MVEQDLEHLRLERPPFGARRRRHRDEVAAEEDALDLAGREDRLGERRGLGLFRRREIARAGIHHLAARKEFQGRGVGRGLGLDQHETDVALSAARDQGRRRFPADLLKTHAIPWAIRGHRRYMILTMAMAAALAAQANEASPPRRARANLNQYFSTDDYPPTAVARGAQGTVGFRLDIGADGAVTSCTITHSSNDAALDAATCAILLGRARYQPARDAAGRAVRGKDQGRVTWRLPAPEDEPFAELQAPARLELTVGTAADGRSVCSAKLDGGGGRRRWRSPVRADRRGRRDAFLRGLPRDERGHHDGRVRAGRRGAGAGHRRGSRRAVHGIAGAADGRRRTAGSATAGWAKPMCMAKSGRCRRPSCAAFRASRTACSRRRERAPRRAAGPCGSRFTSGSAPAVARHDRAVSTDPRNPACRNGPAA